MKYVIFLLHLIGFGSISVTITHVIITFGFEKHVQLELVAAGIVYASFMLVGVGSFVVAVLLRRYGFCTADEFMEQIREAMSCSLVSSFGILIFRTVDAYFSFGSQELFAVGGWIISIFVANAIFFLTSWWVIRRNCAKAEVAY